MPLTGFTHVQQHKCNKPTIKLCILLYCSVCEHLQQNRFVAQRSSRWKTFNGVDGDHYQLFYCTSLCFTAHVQTHKNQATTMTTSCVKLESTTSSEYITQHPYTVVQTKCRQTPRVNQQALQMQTVIEALFKNITKVHISGQNKIVWNSWPSINGMTTSAVGVWWLCERDPGLTVNSEYLLDGTNVCSRSDVKSKIVHQRSMHQVLHINTDISTL